MSLYIILAIYGLYYFLAQSDIFSRIRFWIITIHPFFNDLFNCPFCLGFYCSIIMNAVVSKFDYNLLILGLAGAASTLIIHKALTLINALGEYYYNKINE